MKKLFAALAALVIVSAAYGGPGNPPTPSNGPGLVDGTWLNGLAGGQNETYQSGIAAAGTTQATATQLPAGIALIEIDTVPASSGAALPPALAGTEISIYNSTSTTIVFYPSIRNNPVTGAQDTINNGQTQLSVTGAAAGTVTWFACAKNGVWAAK